MMRALSLSLMAWLVALLGGCGVAAPATGSDAGVDAGAAFDGGAPDAGSVDAGPEPETVSTAHERELRGAWIATVFNINWPSRQGLSASAAQAELRGLFDTAEVAGLNAVVMQIRAECDAFYPSELEPWSRYLTGTQGEDPGWDPLAFAIEEAHARGLELHAWMNPYRASANGAASNVASHIATRRPDLVRTHGDFRWLDPGSQDALAHTLAVVRDVLTRYDIDGLHFDDYFYPYPAEGTGEFDDDATWAAYQSSGGALARDDWRRDNVNRMVSAVHAAVAELRPDVRFGISPFGIYRPGMPAGITGLDQYATLYADPLRWMGEGWVDYVAPQLYWPTTQTAQAYGRLLTWWAEQAEASGTTLFVGNYLAQLGSSSAWSVGEIEEQVRLVRADARVRGNIFYHVDPLLEDRSGVATMLAGDWYGVPVATPALRGASGPPGAPRVQADGADAVVDPSDSLRSWLAYELSGGSYVLRRRVPASAERIGLWRGSWAISALDRRGLESPGARVEITSGEPPTTEPTPEPTGATCTHSFGGVYADTACSPTYQCCDGSWQSRTGGDPCGSCLCVEDTGMTGCGT